MARIRSKPSAVPATTNGAKVTHVTHDSAQLVQLSSLDELAGLRLDGALVKFAPEIKSSERGSFDINAAKAAIYKAGARKVVVVPKNVVEARIDEKKVERVVKATTTRDAVRKWFDAFAGLTVDERAQCIELSERIIEQEEAVR